jgi:hypothetical protein
MEAQPRTARCAPRPLPEAEQRARETWYRRLRRRDDATDEGGAAKNEELRDHGESRRSEGDHPEPACFAALHDDSSGIVNEVHAERITGVGGRDRAARTIPADVEGAIRIAIKLAVEAGEYGCAKALLQLLERAER